MAYMPQTKTESEIKALSISKVRGEYLKLADIYNKIIDGDLKKCSVCGDWLSTKTSYYSDKRYADGLFHKCKNCVRMQVEQKTKKTDEPNETVESVKLMLQEMDLPYIHDLYEAQCKNVADATNEKNRTSPFLAYLVPIKSLPQYMNKHYCHSEFAPNDEESNSDFELKINQKTLKNAKKRFGNDYSNSDLMFLENEYQDWINRYECNTKAQEEVFQSLATIKLQKKEALKSGKSTKELDKSYQDWLDTGNLKPKQNAMDTFADAQTFGTLIQKYEETRPLPEIDENLKDVDNIGLYLDTFYKGNILKCLGLKNPLHHLYEKIMKLFTVDKPEYQEDEDTSTLFEYIFGKEDTE